MTAAPNTSLYRVRIILQTRCGENVAALLLIRRLHLAAKIAINDFMSIGLALYQPDIPQNTGTLMRLCACMGVTLDIIEPCGFVLDDRKLRRAGMDYLDHLTWHRHRGWDDFYRQSRTRPQRLVLLTREGAVPYTDFTFAPGDVLLCGQESAGVPPEIHAACDVRLYVPMQPGFRSLNVAIAAAMVLGEALRQCPLQEVL